MMKRELGYLVAGSCLCAVALACTPDWLAGPCNRDGDKNNELVYWDDKRDPPSGMKPKDGDNYISQNPALFTTCENFLCLSSNGSNPYCTKVCGSDGDCVNGNDVKMECKVATEFGALACRSPTHEFCDENTCKAACPASCVGNTDVNGCKTRCEEACLTEVCCDRDSVTHGVKDPATYCIAKDGTIPHDAKALPAGG